MANIHDISRDRWMLYGPLSRKGYDWWWHSMTAENAETGTVPLRGGGKPRRPVCAGERVHPFRRRKIRSKGLVDKAGLA